LTRFIGTRRSDVRQHPEIAERLGPQAREREQFFLGLVEHGVETGEVRPEDREEMYDFIRTVFIGLTEVTASARRYRRSVEAVKAALRGTLITTVD
jgi:hypothetical protein